jgi:predicted Fe-Mo cluster-binding NifX family protein/DNA-binding PadR family transcriptional regulator
MQNRWRKCGERGCNRRMGGYLDPALLLLLTQSPAHGYTLLDRMAEFSLDFLAPTVIYRALRQMEDKGWVASTRDEEQTQGPPRRVYAITAAGRVVLACCIDQLRSSKQIIEYFLAMHDDLSIKSQIGSKVSANIHTIDIREENMRIVIPAEGNHLDAAVSSVFGRSPTFIFIDPETLDFEVMQNPAVAASGGAGVQAAQTVLQKNVQAVIAPNLGPNAFRVIQAAGVQAYYMQAGSVQQNVDAYKAGDLRLMEMPGPDHAGLGRSRRRGLGH